MVLQAGPGPADRERGGRRLSGALTTTIRRVEDATCLGCACLCDDIGLVVEGHRIVEAARACAKGLAWYGTRQDEPVDGPTIGGDPAELGPAIERIAAILIGASAPTVLGLGGVSVEAQRVAVAIADRVGAVVGVTGGASGALRAFQRVGQVSASFGEIKDRADLIVYGPFPWPEHLPRFRERYADDAPGRFVRHGRTVIRLGDWGRGDGRADRVIPIRDEAATYVALRALVNGVGLDAESVERATGVPPEILSELAGRMAGARYGAFFAPGPGASAAICEAFLTLVRDLNGPTRFVAVHPTSGPVNLSGAVSSLAWNAGTAGEIDFGLGHPRDLPGDGAIGRLLRGEVDAALVVGDPADLGLDDRGRSALAAIPTGIVGPGAKATDHAGPLAVRIPTARPGIDDGGTVSRADGVMLPLRPPFPGRRIGLVEVLRGIERRLSGSGRGHRESGR